MQIKLHRAQSEPIKWLFESKKPEDFSLRYAVLVGSRGIGKSYCAGAAVALAVGELERLDVSVPNKNIAILCGSYQQVIDIYYPLLAYQFGLEARALKASHSQGKFIFPNGTEVKCWSSEAFERIRGSGQYLIVGDEMPTWNTPNSDLKNAWSSVLEPAIVTRWSPQKARELGAPSAGRALLPSTPMGKDFYYELAQRMHEDPRWKTFQYSYRDAPHLPQEEIEALKRHTDPIKFAREYEASFEDSGLRVFYTFDRATHIKTDLPYFEEGETVHCAIDFNIMLNCTSFCAIRGNQLHVLDEHRGSANTEELAEVIHKRFPKDKYKVICYPDPAGRQRRTSAAIGTTDFSILKEKGFTVLARQSSPAIVDSVAAVNRKLMNAKGEVDMYISSNCRGVIDSFDRTTWLENRPENAIIDKEQGVEHYSDGIRYLVEYLWPINFSRPYIAKSAMF